MILDTLIFAIALNVMWLGLHIMDGFTIKRLDKQNSLLRDANADLRFNVAYLTNDPSRYLQDWIEQKPFREHFGVDEVGSRGYWADEHGF